MNQVATSNITNYPENSPFTTQRVRLTEAHVFQGCMMSPTAAALTWITVCWLWVTALIRERTTGWSRTGKYVPFLLMNATNRFNREHHKGLL